MRPLGRDFCLVPVEVFGDTLDGLDLGHAHFFCLKMMELEMILQGHLTPREETNVENRNCTVNC